MFQFNRAANQPNHTSNVASLLLAQIRLPFSSKKCIRSFFLIVYLAIPRPLFGSSMCSSPALNMGLNNLRASSNRRASFPGNELYITVQSCSNISRGIDEGYSSFSKNNAGKSYASVKFFKIRYHRWTISASLGAKYPGVTQVSNFAGLKSHTNSTGSGIARIASSAARVPLGHGTDLKNFTSSSSGNTYARCLL